MIKVECNAIVTSASNAVAIRSGNGRQQHVADGAAAVLTSRTGNAREPTAHNLPLPPVSWLEQTRVANQDFVAVVQGSPQSLGVNMPSNATPRRRSARIAATSRGGGAPAIAAVDSRSNSASTSADDHSSDDEDSNTSGNERRCQPLNRVFATDKTARRRDQVRRASMKRRLKLKVEEVFVRHRLQELELHMQILEREFPIHDQGRRLVH